MFNQHFQNLTNINPYLTNTEKFYKVLLIRLRMGLYRLYWLNIGLLKLALLVTLVKYRLNVGLFSFLS